MRYQIIAILIYLNYAQYVIINYLIFMIFVNLFTNKNQFIMKICHVKYLQNNFIDQCFD